MTGFRGGHISNHQTYSILTHDSQLPLYLHHPSSFSTTYTHNLSWCMLKLSVDCGIVRIICIHVWGKIMVAVTVWRVSSRNPDIMPQPSPSRGCLHPIICFILSAGDYPLWLNWFWALFRHTLCSVVKWCRLQLNKKLQCFCLHILPSCTTLQLP